MSSANNDFRFELNEVLYFDRGNEVLELLGLSLSPEITIHSYDSYVSIRGNIELRGEYVRDEVTIEEEEPLSFDNFEAKRYVERVEEKEEQQAEFSHHFPVDISVPPYRVDNLDDIRIDIIDFDYEFPSNDRLELRAVAEIQGVKSADDLWNEQARASEAETEDNSSESFSLELKREETDFSEVEDVEIEGEEDRNIVEAADVKVEESKDREIEALENEVEEEVTEWNQAQDEEEENLPEQAKENELNIRAKEEEVNEADEEENAQTNEVKDVSYLADMFRDDEEENFTKMKIWIVQEDDTIEMIAERFQISALQLIKQNKLDEDFDISEGQLLYIPKK